jgi:hypothetical protein
LFVARNITNYIGHVIGNGHCVGFVRHIADVPVTSEWRQGPRVRHNKVASGTVIATFRNGRYQNDIDGNSHAAIFLEEKPDGLHVVDQWIGRPVGPRIIRFRNGQGYKINDGDQYYVVRTE